MTLRVRLLGRPSIDGVNHDAVEDGAPTLPQPRGRKSWALLARIALAERALHRSELAGELFDSADDPLAALRWGLADLRRSLGRPDLLRGDPVEPLPPAVEVDVRQLRDGTLPARQVGLVLLEGVEPDSSPEFETWLLLARTSTAARAREELRAQTLRALAVGDTDEAVHLAGIAARGDSLDEGAQELLLRALVANGRSDAAAAHLAACAGTFAREGIPVSPALRDAASHGLEPPTGIRAAITAASLLQAGTAALDAGAADGGVDTLRRAAAAAARAHDSSLRAEVLLALGTALVHAVRGFDGEGAVVLHQALIAARDAGRPHVAAEVLRELAFVDVQAGRHHSADRALRAAESEAGGLDDPALHAAILALDGMNHADQGRHLDAVALLTRSGVLAQAAARPRQQAWSLGLLARSELLAGSPERAMAAAEASMGLCRRQRWNAFLPWPQAIHADGLLRVGRWEEAAAEAEEAFALGCELGDPCWEGMAARVLGLVAEHEGEHDKAWRWFTEARRRTDRVSDRYVWVSGYTALAQLEFVTRTDPRLARELRARLLRDATLADLPEFMAWALAHHAADGDGDTLHTARAVARTVQNPALHGWLDALAALVEGAEAPARAGAAAVVMPGHQLSGRGRS